MLDVDGGDHVDSRAKDLQHILPAFVVPAGSRHIRVRKLVDERDFGPSSQDRVEIHLLQAASPVLDFHAGDDLQAVDQRLGVRPPVRLDVPDDDIGAARPRGAAPR